MASGCPEHDADERDCSLPSMLLPRLVPRRVKRTDAGLSIYHEASR